MSFALTQPPQIAKEKDKKPIYKRWYVWVLSILAIFIAIIIITIGTIAATGRSDGFSDEESKELAWEAYKCSAAEELDASFVGLQISMDVLQGKIPSSELQEANRFAKRMNSANPGEKTVSDYMQYTSTKDASHMCTGWLWEYLKGDDYWEGYDSFTHDKAVEAGVYK